MESILHSDRKRVGGTYYLDLEGENAELQIRTYGEFYHGDYDLNFIADSKSQTIKMELKSKRLEMVCSKIFTNYSEGSRQVENFLEKYR